MIRHLTQGEALEDFLSWIKQQPMWATMERREKQYIYKTRQAQFLGTLGVMRLQRMFQKYCPDRYRVEYGFVLLQ